jgi:hypothetical protein
MTWFMKATAISESGLLGVPSASVHCVWTCFGMVFLLEKSGGLQKGKVQHFWLEILAIQ